MAIPLLAFPVVVLLNGCALSTTPLAPSSMIFSYSPSSLVFLSHSLPHHLFPPFLMCLLSPSHRADLIIPPSLIKVINIDTQQYDRQRRLIVVLLVI